MRYAEQIVTAEDGTDLFVRRYEPDSSSAGRSVVVVHGAAEHGGRYAHVAGELVERGWDVVAADLRGHGRSSGPRTHVGSFGRYVADLNRILNRLRLAPEQTALLGHSLGGLISIRFAERIPGRVAGLVLISPLLGVNVEIPQTTLALGRMVALVWPRWRFRSRVNPADTTRCPETLRRRADDPLIHRTLTAGWYFQMQRALRRAWAEAPGLTLPLLVLQAGEDRIVDPAVVAPWLDSAGSADKTFRLLPDNLHELLNEPDWKSTTGQIADWLQRRIDPSGAAQPEFTAAAPMKDGR